MLQGGQHGLFTGAREALFSIALSSEADHEADALSVRAAVWVCYLAWAIPCHIFLLSEFTIFPTGTRIQPNTTVQRCPPSPFSVPA